MLRPSGGVASRFRICADDEPLFDCSYLYDPLAECPRGLGSIAVSADGGFEPDDDEREAGTRNGHRAERTRLPSRMRAPENKIALIIR